MHLLITRAEPDNSAQLKALQSRGASGILAPLLHIKPDKNFVPDVMMAALAEQAQEQALILTSRNALRVLDHELSKDQHSALKRLPLFAVGPATGELARQFGFRRVICAAGNAESLIPLILDHCRAAETELHFLSGRHIAADIARTLSAAGLSLHRHIIYDSIAADELPVSVQNAVLGQNSEDMALDGVILMSPRTAHIYISLIERHGLHKAAQKLHYFCLSPAIAAVLTNWGANQCHITAETEQNALFELIDQVSEQL